MDILKNYIKDLKNDLKNKSGYKHIPNLLTFIRCISPFFIIPFVLLKKYNIVLLLVIISALTDFIDGIIARKYNITSEFGRLFDAVTDKFFSVALLIPILNINIIFVFVLVIEILIALVNLIAEKQNKKPHTLYIGKVKTAFQSLFLSFCYLSFVINIKKVILYILFGIVIVFEILTLINYILKSFKTSK